MFTHGFWYFSLAFLAIRYIIGNMILALDTDVVVAALRSQHGASRRLIEHLRCGQVTVIASIGMFVKSLLEEVKRIAADENTTINQFINVAVAEKAATLRTEAYFRERAERSDLTEFDRILAKAGIEPARHGDEMPCGKKRSTIDR